MDLPFLLFPGHIRKFSLKIVPGRDQTGLGDLHMPDSP